MTDASYDCRSVIVPPGSYLYLFSDGIYEIMTKEGRVWTLGELTSVLAHPSDRERNEPGSSGQSAPADDKHA